MTEPVRKLERGSATVSGKVPVAATAKGRLRKQNRSSATQEAKHARATQGAVQAGSGSSWRRKGDVVSKDHVDELKETDGKSFAVTTTIIDKIITAAEQMGREPRLIVDFKAIGVRAVITFEDI